MYYFDELMNKYHLFHLLQPSERNKKMFQFIFLMVYNLIIFRLNQHVKEAYDDNNIVLDRENQVHHLPYIHDVIILYKLPIYCQ